MSRHSSSLLFCHCNSQCNMASNFLYSSLSPQSLHLSNQLLGTNLNGPCFRHELNEVQCSKSRANKFKVTCSLQSKVSDMSKQAPKGLFPPEPEKYKGPKLKVAIIGAGLAGMSTAVELLDQGHEVDIYESRSFVGGKVGSFVDKAGNHIEMGLHVFFGCYNNLFRLMKKVGADENLLVKEHTHTFINEGGRIGELDFRFLTGAPLHGIKAFLTTNQLLVSFSKWFMSHGGTRLSIQRIWDPVAYALGFIDCDNISARCMLTIFVLFAIKTEASLLRMLKGSPDLYLSGPIRKYITERGGRFHLRWGCREILYDRTSEGDTYVRGLRMSKATQKQIVSADAYVAACDVPGIKRLIPPEWREWEFFENIYKLVGVPVVTVQLRFNGWVTELQDLERSRVVLTPGDPYMPLPNEEIVDRVHKQLIAIVDGESIVRYRLSAILTLTTEKKLLPFSEGVIPLSISPRTMTWSSVVKIGQSLYREAPGMDPFRPNQRTPVQNFFLAGSYTKQDYIDSMEGATLSGRQAASYICDAGTMLAELRSILHLDDVLGNVRYPEGVDELTFV